MKTIRFSLACFFCLFFLIEGVFGQNCYVRLDDDASGYTPTAEQIAELEAAADSLCAAFDSAGFEGQFKVYDFGFYLHQEVTQGWYPEPFTQKILEVEQLSPYYLLFGKQTDQSGVYTKLWVELKMPDSLQFSCMTALQREVYFKRVQTTTEERYLELGNSHTEYHRAEIAGINELFSIIAEIKDCCIARAGNRSSSCDGCSDEIANSYFELSGFRKINLELTPAAFANIKFSLIRDYSFHKVTISEQTDYLGNHLSSILDEFNTWFTINVLVTSNQSLCIDSISGSNLDLFKLSEDFLCQINLPTGQGLTSSNVKIIWNNKTTSWIKDSETANLIINLLYCKLYRALGIGTEDCFEYLSIPPEIANMNDFPNFDFFYTIYLHSLHKNINIIDLIEAYEVFGIIGNSTPENVTPTPLIDNGIEIVNSSVGSQLYGTLIAESPARGNTEDISHGTNGDCTGIIRNCFNNYDDEYLFGVMTGLFHNTSMGNLQLIGDEFIQRFRDKISSDYYHLGLIEEVRQSPNMINYMKSFGEQLNNRLRSNNGNINIGAPILMTTRPAFTGMYNRFHGLTILINDTEHTTIYYLDGFTLNSQTGVWSGNFYFEVTDHFGLDKEDVLKYQGVQLGFAAWWVLQHKRDYPPYRTKFTILATLKGKI